MTLGLTDVEVVALAASCTWVVGVEVECTARAATTNPMALPTANPANLSVQKFDITAIPCEESDGIIVPLKRDKYACSFQS